MKWLIIGTGLISESFIRALKATNQDVVGIYSRNIEKAQAFADKHNIEVAITNISDANNYDFHTAYIASPNSIHYAQAEKLIKMGLNVMIEKPMTHSLKLTKKLYALAKKNKVRIMEAYAHITNRSHSMKVSGDIKTNYMRVSSKIKNATYKEASSFSKEMFGGVITDLGVYPISLCISLLGEVKDVEIKNIEFMNKVPSSSVIKMIHKRGSSEFKISKIEDGDNTVYLNDKKIINHVSCSDNENRMEAEIRIFVKNEELEWYKTVSLETARIVEIINTYE